MTTPWRSPKPGRQEGIALTPKPRQPAPTSSWWARYAAADTSFTAFSEAAKRRDAEMRAQSHEWCTLKATPGT